MTRPGFYLASLIVLVAMTAAGAVIAQGDDEKTLENYYNEIAAGTVASEVTGDTGEVSGEMEGEVGIEIPVSSEEEIEPVDEDEAAKGDVKPWEKGGKRRHMSLNGATGLFRVVEAGSDEQWTLGGGFHGAYFKYSDYLFNGDEHSAMWSGLNLRITPLKFLEFFVGAQTDSHYNTLGSPKLYQSIGNVEPGLKGFVTLGDWITIAGMVGVHFKNPVGEVDFQFKGTSFDVALLSTFDFGELNQNLPLRAHLNIGYLFDNSARLVETLERDGGGCSEDVDGDGNLDFYGCLDAIERKSLGIDRNDQLRLGVGFDLGLPYISPIVEYWLDVPVNRQDFTCPEDVPGSYDSCMAVEGFGGMRQWVSLGVRVLPPVDSLAIDVGFDIGLKGWGPTVHELAAQDPYRFVFGLSYSFNMLERVVETPVCESVPVPVTEPEKMITSGIITGHVYDKSDPSKPVQGATVTYKGMGLANQTSDSYGKFQSPLIPLGDVALEITADGYETGTFNINVPHPAAAKTDPGQEDIANPYKVEVDYDFAMVKMAPPVPPSGAVLIRVVDEDGKPVVGAEVSFQGPEVANEISTAEGKVSRDLELGAYSVTVQKEGYLRKAKSVSVEKDSLADVEVKLAKKSAKASVIIRNKRIVLKKKIHFNTGSADIKEGSQYLLDEVADVFMSHTEIKKLEIQGHSDNVGKQSYNMKLSEERAEAVETYLIGAGVKRSRLQSKGFGPTKPIAPNVTPQGRARNRRVEFHILERDGD